MANSRIVRSFPYPVLEDGNLSFAKGSYNVDIKSTSDTSIVLEHQLKNASLIEKLISQKKAEYGCLVAIPQAGYRKLHLSSVSSQTIEWDSDFVATPPIFKPIIVCAKAHQCKLDKKDGIAEEWEGIPISIPKGARLALKRFFRQDGNIIGLLSICPNPSFREGSFEIKARDDEGFFFKVEMATDLSNFVQNPGEYSGQRKSIFTHIISRCFEILEKDYGRDDENGEGKWEQFGNLKALADDLKSKGLPIWDEDGFFADKVATQYEPHCPPPPDSED